VIFFINRTLQIQQDQLLEKTNLKLKLSNIQYEWYKNNLNPGFLSQSLHTLQSIIKTDKNKAEIFLVKLSKTYRYLLEIQNKEKIAVRDELEFTFQYLFLINQIKNSNIEIKLKNEIPNDKHVLPHTIGLLIEHISENLKNQVSERFVININFTEKYISIIPGNIPDNTDLDQTILNYDQIFEKYTNYEIPVIITIEKTAQKALKLEYV
jgi:LytS/YehU family sensor histidine kinase